jgi:hypothetical protein
MEIYSQSTVMIKNVQKYIFTKLQLRIKKIQMDTVLNDIRYE